MTLLSKDSSKINLPFVQGCMENARQNDNKLIPEDWEEDWDSFKVNYVRNFKFIFNEQFEGLRSTPARDYSNAKSPQEELDSDRIVLTIQ